MDVKVDGGSRRRRTRDEARRRWYAKQRVIRFARLILEGRFGKPATVGSCRLTAKGATHEEQRELQQAPGSTQAPPSAGAASAPTPARLDLLVRDRDLG